MKKFRKAFSLVELIIVIVVIGILATMTTQRLKRDNRDEAINQMLTMIRYTRSLALHDDKQLRDNPKWQRRFWRFGIYRNNSENLCFVVASNENMNSSIDKDETAIDPSNGKRLYCTSTGYVSKYNDPDLSPNVFLFKRFGLKSVSFKFTDGTNYNTKYLSFDKFGRIYKSNGSSTVPNYSSYVKKDVNITFYFENNSTKPFSVIVNKETGFAHIDGYPNL